MIYLILIILGLYTYLRYEPRLEYVKESKMFILHYNFDNSRSYLVIFRF